MCDVTAGCPVLDAQCIGFNGVRALLAFKTSATGIVYGGIYLNESQLKS